MMHLSFVRGRRTAGKDILAELVIEIQVILDLIPDIRSLLPLIYQTGLIPFKHPMRVHPRHCYRLLRIQLHETFLILHTCSGLATEFRPCNKNRPGSTKFLLNFFFNQSVVIHNVNVCTGQIYKRFPRFSKLHSQDFQSSTPKIFNLVSFFNLSINMRTFVELSDTLQNAATGAT